MLSRNLEITFFIPLEHFLMLQFEKYVPLLSSINAFIGILRYIYIYLFCWVDVCQWKLWTPSNIHFLGIKCHDANMPCTTDFITACAVCCVCLLFNLCGRFSYIGGKISSCPWHLLYEASRGGSKISLGATMWNVLAGNAKEGKHSGKIPSSRYPSSQGPCMFSQKHFLREHFLALTAVFWASEALDLIYLLMVHLLTSKWRK